MQAESTYISEKVRDASNVVINPATEEGLTSIADLVAVLAEQGDDGKLILSNIARLLMPLTVVTSGSNRLSIDVQNVLGTISTVTTVANQSNMGGLSAFDMQYNLSHMAYAASIGNFQ